jgi:hypothetical protein
MESSGVGFRARIQNYFHNERIVLRPLENQSRAASTVGYAG